jgi:hypothetical protein
MVTQVVQAVVVQWEQPQEIRLAVERLPKETLAVQQVMETQAVVAIVEQEFS